MRRRPTRPALNPLGSLFEHEPCNRRSQTGRAGDSRSGRKHQLRDRGRTAAQAHPTRGRAGRRFGLVQSGRRSRTALDAFEPCGQSKLEADSPARALQQSYPRDVADRRGPHRRELLRRRLLQRAFEHWALR